ncbi:hypothetical protein J1614_003847 [Plenodomus biglobosus]|nr:hypothetical protein J1614_003847 [Plenodomus biglobosus]
MHYYTRSLRMDCASRHFACSARELSRYFIDRHTKRPTPRELRAESTALLRDEHRQRAALRRRNIPFTKLDVGAVVGKRRPGPRQFPTTTDREVAQLSKLIERYNDEDTKISSEASTDAQMTGQVDETDHQTQLSLDLLTGVAPQINDLLRRLMMSTDDYERFEGLSNEVLCHLRRVAPALKHLGPRALQVGWDWCTFRAVYEYLLKEDEWGRLYEPLVSHRKVLKEAADLVGLDLECVPPQGARPYPPSCDTPDVEGSEAMDESDYATARPYEPGRDQPIWSRQHSSATAPPSSSISSSEQPPFPTTTSFTQSASSSAPSLSESFSSTFSQSTTSTAMTSSSTFGTPSAPPQPTAEVVKDTSRADVNTDDVMPAPSPTVAPKESTVAKAKAPQAIAAAPIVPVVAPAPSTKDSDIRMGVGKFDPAAVSNMDELIAILNDPEYSIVRAEKAVKLFNDLHDGIAITAHHTEFLIRSCQYILVHEKAPWFKYKEVLDRAASWYGNPSNGMDMVRMGINKQDILDNESFGDKAKELKPLHADLTKIYMIMNGRPSAGGRVVRAPKARG